MTLAGAATIHTSSSADPDRTMWFVTPFTVLPSGRVP